MSTAPTTGRRRAAPWLPLAGLLLAYLWAQLAAIPIDSPTVDEQNHLARGLSLWRTGDYRLLIGHPPLINLVSALPLHFDSRIELPLDDRVWREADWIEFAISLLWKLDNPALAMIYAGRIMIALLGALALAALYRLGADLGGPAIGLLTAFVAALDPNFRAHARLITTDLGILLTVTLTMIAWRRWLGRPRPGALPAAGLSLGLALGSKFSALVFAPALLGVAIWRWGATAAALRRLAAVMVVTGLSVWALYLFELRPLEGWPFPIPLANYWEDFYFTTEVVHTPNYMLGRVSPPHDWLYFFVALAVKTPLPSLALIGLGLATWLKPRWRAEAVVWLPAALYFGVAIVSQVYIGYRHLFPLLPVLYLAAAFGARWLWGRARGGRALAGALLAWLAINTALIYPRDLTFFNLLAGGPDNGWRILVDSNLDWGQDLRELSEFVRERGLTEINVSYFGAVPVVSMPIAAYPLPARPLPPHPAPDFQPLFPRPGWYAISVNHLLGAAGLRDPDTFAFFRLRQPDVILGRTIYVYHVPDERGTVAACVNPPPYLGEETVRRTFGLALTRFIAFDCEKGLPLPRGLTWYLLRGEQRELLADALARLEAQPIYQPDYPGDPEFAQAIFRVEDPAALAERFAEQPAAPRTFGGLVTFLGHRYREPLAAGQAAQVQTVWRIEAALPEPASLFLHLTAADGFTLAVSDGLNSPFDSLRPGDALVQYHPLTFPAAQPAGARWRVGLYALGGAQDRYRLPSGEDAVAFPVP